MQNIQPMIKNQQFDLLEQDIPIYYENIEYYPSENLLEINYQQNVQLSNPNQKNYLQMQLINPIQQQYIQQQQQQYSSSQNPQYYYFQQYYPQNQNFGQTKTTNQNTQIIKIEDRSQGGFDQMTESKGYDSISSNQQEITQACYEIRPTALSTSMTESSNNNDYGTLSSSNSLNQTSSTLSPTTICSQKINKQSSFKIDSLQHIQDQSYDNQNLSTQQLDQSFNQSYSNLQTSEKSSPIESSFITCEHSLPVQQKSVAPADTQSDNRRIIQTYQKISKININKNIIKAFKKFMLDKENSDTVTSFGFMNQSKNQCNQMKIFFDSLNHNNHSVTKIIDHPIYGGAFEFFLTFYAEPWLQSSRVQDKDAHFIAIDFFKLCCSENKVKLSNFKYYSKRKIDNNKKTSNTDKSSSQQSKILKKEQISEQECNQSINDEMESVFIYQVNSHSNEI